MSAGLPIQGHPQGTQATGPGMDMDEPPVAPGPLVTATARSSLAALERIQRLEATAQQHMGAVGPAKLAWQQAEAAARAAQGYTPAQSRPVRVNMTKHGA
jgi:hypothetical protein